MPHSRRRRAEKIDVCSFSLKSLTLISVLGRSSHTHSKPTHTLTLPLSYERTHTLAVLATRSQAHKLAASSPAALSASPAAAEADRWPARTRALAYGADWKMGERSSAQANRRRPALANRAFCVCVCVEWPVRHYQQDCRLARRQRPAARATDSIDRELKTGPRPAASAARCIFGPALGVVVTAATAAAATSGELAV
jgi:hypothetical protein